MKSLCTSIDPIAAGASYYVTANGPAAKPYILLHTALARSSKVAVAKVGFRGRECLALLRTLGGCPCLPRDALARRDPLDLRRPVPDAAVDESVARALAGAPCAS
ncbi:Ku protein [Streptomyces sp. I05A-00742]|uniref:Ku protein n=1 Tax=Streptomyces sp. I05A-00742 TaxID=2732853 RepID=UPI00148923CA|nr:Ku protein [Streptomyces sp. I05A-00742]